MQIERSNPTRSLSHREFVCGGSVVTHSNYLEWQADSAKPLPFAGPRYSAVNRHSDGSRRGDPAPGWPKMSILWP